MKRITFAALVALLLVVSVFGCTNIESILTDDGSASAPAHSFTSDTDLGFFRSAANTLDLAAAGISEFQFTTGQMTVGDASEGDDAIVFDGNAQDFYLALDDSADDLLIGLGSTVGTTPAVQIDENLDLTLCDASEADCDATFDGNAQDFYIGLDDSADDLLIGLGGTVGTTGIIHLDENQDVGLGGASAGSKLDVTGNVLIDGAADEAQLTVQGNGTQTTNPFIVEQSDGTDVLTVDNNGSATQTINTAENVGMLPTIVSSTITYTAAAGGSGTVATIADGEIWYVHAVFANVTTNWDATGDDALVEIGDGNDADGLLDLDDAELQAADTEGTGAPAGWQGFMSTDTRGAYLANGHGFIYAPSGAAETIDYNIDETSGETLSAGQLTVYVVYTRLQ